MFLITGHCRSGTGYTSKLFRDLGYDVPHEVVGEDGCVSWKHLPNWDKFTTVIHQVRHPLKVIGSTQAIALEAFEEMFGYVGRPDSEDRLVWAMWTWLKWCKWADRVSDERFRIENFDSVYPAVFSRLGLPLPSGLPDTPKDTNTRKGLHSWREFTWRNLLDANAELAADIYELATGYGYPPESFSLGG